jgi:hypothetical protein
MADDRISREPLGRPSPVPREPDREPDRLPSLAGGGGGELSSLAQAARQKQLRSARNTLIAIGVLTVLAQIALSWYYQTTIDNQLRKVGVDPRNLPPEVQHALLIDYATQGLILLLGVVFILLGLFVNRYPVPCTVTGLVLYILAWLGSGIFNPASLAAGLIIKIVIIAFLFRAVQAAFAYERERNEVPLDHASA